MGCGSVRILGLCFRIIADINPGCLDAVQNHNLADLFAVSLWISTFWLCLHLYFCCIHSRKFTLCLFTLFFSETFSIMGPIQHGEQLSVIEIQKAAQHSVSFIASSSKAAELSLKRGGSPGNLKPRPGRQWTDNGRRSLEEITGNLGHVTRCH